MRLWSLHPRYLDARGLVALWREGLLAQRALSGAARGYRHHPQLARFRAQPDPAGAIAAYLRAVLVEATQRGYRFDAGKVGRRASGVRMTVTRGQLLYELAHLRAKLADRNPDAWQRLAAVAEPEPHPQFDVVSGEAENWEVIPHYSRPLKS